jgi:enoyl-CoA hydratase
VILADQRISAAEAYEWGLVEQVTEPGASFHAAMEFAEKIAAQPPVRSSPPPSTGRFGPLS